MAQKSDVKVNALPEVKTTLKFPNLGTIVMDPQSGITGPLVFRSLDMNGNVRFCIQPKTKTKDGETPKLEDAIMVDYHYLEKVPGVAFVHVPITPYPHRVGMKVKDRVTGMRGRITNLTEYLNGCVHAEVISKVSKKDLKKGLDARKIFVPIQRLEIDYNYDPLVVVSFEETKRQVLEGQDPPGGPPEIVRREKVARL